MQNSVPEGSGMAALFKLFGAGAMVLVVIYLFSFTGKREAVSNVILFPITQADGTLDLSAAGPQDIENIKAALVPTIAGLKNLPELTIIAVSPTEIEYHLSNAEILTGGSFMIDSTLCRVNLRLTVSGY